MDADGDGVQPAAGATGEGTTAGGMGRSEMQDDSVQYGDSSGAGTSGSGASGDGWQQMQDDMAEEDAQAGEGADGVQRGNRFSGTYRVRSSRAESSAVILPV